MHDHDESAALPYNAQSCFAMHQNMTVAGPPCLHYFLEIQVWVSDASGFCLSSGAAMMQKWVQSKEDHADPEAAIFFTPGLVSLMR